MAKIAVDRAPSPALPRRYLLTASVWGVFAGVLLLIDGDAALQTRWAPATLALVHAFTLGVLGNAMFGSLLQFLPAAAGVHVHGGTRAGWVLHGLLNLGTALLVMGFGWMQPGLLLAAGAILAAAFALFASMLLPGVVVAHGQRLLHAGIAGAVICALVTATLGVAMLLDLAGYDGLPLLPWADVHAAWGVLGWSLGLLASVSAVVLPMFQGTRRVPAKTQMAWLGALGVVLIVGTSCVAAGQGAAVLRWGGASCLALFALAGLWLQWRAPHSRNVWLVRCWRAGLLALLAAAGVLATGGPPVLLGTLVLGIGLPWLVAGMQLEIVAFLGWIELHRRCGRGLRLPSVQSLLPEAHKAGVFAMYAVAGAALTIAATWPTPASARVAAVALMIAHALLWWRLCDVGRKVQVFVAKTQRTAPSATATRAY